MYFPIFRKPETVLEPPAGLLSTSGARPLVAEEAGAGHGHVVSLSSTGLCGEGGPMPLGRHEQACLRRRPRLLKASSSLRALLWTLSVIACTGDRSVCCVLPVG